VVIGWLAYEITRSAFLTSVAMGLDALPILLAGPLGGLVADAFDKRRLLIFAYLYQSVLTLTFASFVMLGTVAIWHMFAFILLTGLSWVITDPTRSSMLPGIVPREGLMNAFALNSMAFSVSRLATPALGGLLLASAGAGLPLLLVGTLHLMAMVVVLPIRFKNDSRAVLRVTTAFSQLSEGARYVAAHPVLRPLFLVAIIPPLMVMPFVHGLMPVYAAEVFNVGPTGLGLLLSAIGIGSTAGAFILATWAKFHRRGRVVLIGIAVMAVTMIAFSRSPLYGTAIPIIIVLSAGMMMFFSVTSASIQSVVRNDYRGRVSGLYMVTWGLFPVGSLTAGALAQGFGAPMATLLSGVAVLIALAGIGLWVRSLWSLDS
jgi:predicted MFS family arabinose efflux permease